MLVTWNCLITRWKITPAGSLWKWVAAVGSGRGSCWKEVGKFCLRDCPGPHKQPFFFVSVLFKDWSETLWSHLWCCDTILNSLHECYLVFCNSPMRHIYRRFMCWGHLRLKEVHSFLQGQTLCTCEPAGEHSASFLLGYTFSPCSYWNACHH